MFKLIKQGGFTGGNAVINNFNVENCFNESYNDYYIEVSQVDGNLNYYNNMRLLDATGTLITASEYQYASLQMTETEGFGELRGTTTAMQYGSYSGSRTSDTLALGYFVYSPYDASSYTFVSGKTSGNVNTNKLVAFRNIFSHQVEERITGINFHGHSHYTEFLVNIYGIEE